MSEVVAFFLLAAIDIKPITLQTTTVESTEVGLSTDPAPLIISIFSNLGFYGLKASL